MVNIFKHVGNEIGIDWWTDYFAWQGKSEKRNSELPLRIPDRENDMEEENVFNKNHNLEKPLFGFCPGLGQEWWWMETVGKESLVSKTLEN